MWTRKSALIVSASISSFLLGIVAGNYQLLIVGIVFGTVAILSYMRPIPELKLERKLKPAEVVVDDKVKVCLSITNNTPYGIIPVEIYDKLPTIIRLVEGCNFRILRLKPFETVKFEYTISSPLRGLYKIGPLQVRYRDFFNLFTTQVELESTSELLVYPRPTAVATTTATKQIFARTIKPLTGTLPYRRLGAGTEFHSIRDYIPSDPFRRINWKLSAKLKKLMVNQYLLEEVYNIIIFIDTREVTTIGTAERNPLELGIQLVSALTTHYLAFGNRVGIVFYGESVKILAPGIGDQHKALIHRVLATIHPAGMLPLKTATKLALPYITQQSVVIIVSPLDRDDSILEAVKNLQELGATIIMVSIDTLELERELVGDMGSPRYWLTKLERKNKLQSLREAGIKIIDWHPSLDAGRIATEVV